MHYARIRYRVILYELIAFVKKYSLNRVGFRLILPLLLLAVATGGCSLIHHNELRQGLVQLEEIVAQLHIGMSKNEVRDLVDNQFIQHPYRGNVWIIAYYYRDEDKQWRAHRSIELHFADDDTLAKIHPLDDEATL